MKSGFAKVASTKSPTSAAAVLGTLSVTPPNGAAVRLASVIDITVTITLSKGDTLPPGAYAILQVTEGGTLTTNPQQPFVLVGSNPTIADAVFYVAVGLGAQHVTFTVETDGNYVSATPLNVEYQPILPAAKVLYSDPNPLSLPTAHDDQQMPTNTACTIHYAAVVKDERDEPISDYVVEWEQVWDANAFENMRPFASRTSNVPLVPDFSDFHKDGVVRTKTDSNGISDLYMVSTTKQVYFALEPTGNIAEPTPLAAVIVFGEIVNPNLQLPQPALIKNMSGIYDLDLTPGVNLPINAPVDSSYWPPNTTIEVLMFVNEMVGVKILEYTSLLDKPQNLVFNTAKSHFYNDAQKDNNIFYVRAIQGADVGRSPSWLHPVTGDNNGNQPDPNVTRVLDVPAVLFCTDQGINVQTVQTGLYLQIPVHQYPNIWTPEEGDIITATIYLNGWDSQSGQRKRNSFSQSRSISDENLTDFHLEMQFPYREVIGYDSSPTPTSGVAPSAGVFFADYYVVKYNDVAESGKIYSYIYSNSIDTAGPGYINDSGE